ncbi:MAG: polysaccharide deacetylase family protein [Bacteroidia bacterium]|nr:polysaccharide deacetylase family protein [Bacteroidia bacterium]
MIIVYTNKISNRLKYACNFIFTEFFGIEFKLTSNPAETNSPSQGIINYSTEKIISSFQVIPSGLLEETEIRKTEFKVKKKNGLPVMFLTDDTNLGFDIFSFVFFFLSRYEEYMSFTPDKHNRFPATESLAYKHDFLESPVVDEWLIFFETELRKKFPDLNFKKRAFTYLSTIDIDNAFAFKGKGFLRFGGAIARSAIKRNYSDVGQRLKFLSGKVKDPFDHYDFQMKLSKITGIPLIYFVLYAKKGEFDVSLSPGTPEFDSLIKKIAEKTTIGIHPSYASNSDKEIVLNEINDLTFLTQKKITKSRQHFLKFSFPNTPRLLIDYGITEDYSMGFSTHNGFRAGTSNSFHFYDLTKEQATKLKLFPFQVMDSVFYDQQKMNVQESWAEIKNICDVVYKTKGNFISVWHDRSFDQNLFEGWRENYVKMNKYCKEIL